jgi:hypothetical protein
LDFADPDRDAGELGREGVEFKALDAFRTNRRKHEGKAKLFGFEVGLVFDVFERVQREVEEVS